MRKSKTDIMIVEQFIINRMHDLVYDKCYNHKSIFKMIHAEYGITRNESYKIFKKLSTHMQENSIDMLNLAGEKVLTVLFELLDDQNTLVRLKAIEMVMRFMQINIEKLNTDKISIENISYKIIPQKDE